MTRITRKILGSFLAVAMMFGVLGIAAPAQVFANAPRYVSITVTDMDGNAIMVGGVQFALEQAGNQLDTRASNFGIVAIPLNAPNVEQLSVRFVGAQGFYSALTVVPLSEFTVLPDGTLQFRWPVSTTPVAQQPVVPTDPVTPADPVVPTDPVTPADPVIPEDPATTFIPSATSLRFQIGNSSFYNQSIPMQMEGAPFISLVDGRTMIPLGIVGEALGVDVAWDGATRTVTLTEGTRVLRLTIGTPLPDGMGTPVIVSDRTFVPVNYIATELGATVRWCEIYRLVYITR